MSDTLTGLRVLLVADDADGRELLTYVLELAGARVTAAAGADEALEAIHASAPDVLVSDLFMPGRSGTDLVRELRGLAVGHAIPALAVTGGSPEHCREARREGFDDCLRRPFEPDVLVERVCRLCGRHNTPPG